MPQSSGKGAVISIRKFSRTSPNFVDLINKGSVTKDAARFLDICIYLAKNLIISGGTGSGKTTLLNVLGSRIPGTQRLLIIEDAHELKIKTDHVVYFETRAPLPNGKGALTVRELIKSSLRLRPDRIVVGECRGGEALDMLQAMNTGHDGSMTTTHANSPREAIARLETLCLMAGMDLPVRSIREQIAGAVHLIIQISRLPDGSRKIMSITEVQGMQGDVVTLQEIFKFKETGFDRKTGKILGTFQVGGAVPKFIEVFERKGIKIPRSIFQATPTPETSAANTTSVPPKKVGG
jgi:septum site-determining protein MinD